MEILSELCDLYEKAKNLDGQNYVVVEMEKLDDQYNDIMDKAKDYLYNRKDEASSITGTVKSKVERLQQDEIAAREKIDKIEKRTQTKTR